jgi:hypothetical protein
LYNDGVRPEELGYLIGDLSLTSLFAVDESEPIVSPFSSVRERLGFRSEVLQETLLNAKSQLDGSRKNLRQSNGAQYAELIKKQATLQAELTTLENELSQLSDSTAPVKLAVELATTWDRRDRLASRFNGNRSVDDLLAIANDVETLDSTIATLRSEIAKAKRESRKRPDSGAGISKSRLRDIRTLIDEAALAEASERECDHLRQAIRELSSRTDVITPRDLAGVSQSRLLKILLPFAQEVQRAQTRLDEIRRLALAVDDEADDDDESSKEATELGELAQTEIEDLSEQIHLLNQACEQLRGRQSLPTGAWMGIFAVFVSGLALNACGILFDLSGNEWLAIGIGVLAMFSAGMLKISLERAPVVQLRSYRREVNRLLNRIAGLRLTSDPAGNSLPNSEIALRSASENLDVAIHNWRQALSSKGVPESTTPNELIEQFRIRHDTTGLDAVVDSFGKSSNDLFAAGVAANLTRTGFADGDHSTPLDKNMEVASNELRTKLQAESSLIHNWRQSAARELQIPLDEFGNAPVASVADRLQMLKTQIEESHNQAEQRGITDEQTEQQLQLSLKKLKRERRQRISSAGVETLIELKELIKTERKRTVDQAEITALTQQIDDVLAATPTGEETRSLLNAHDHEQNAAELATLQQKQAEAKQKLLDQQRQLSQVAQQINELIKNRDRDTNRLEYGEADAKIKRATHDLVSNLILQEALESRSTAQDQPSVASQNGLIACATDYLRRTTSWKEAEIRFDEESEQFCVDRIGQFSKSLEELDDDYALQATLCIQLALFEHFQATGLVLPVLLADHWTHPKRKFATETVDLLSELGRNRGHQFLVIAWDDSMAQFYIQCGQPVLVVDQEEEHTVRELVYDEAFDHGVVSEHHRMDKSTYEPFDHGANRHYTEPINYDEIDAA